MLSSDRKQQNSVKQLSFNKKEGEGGMIWENGIETCISYKTRITSLGSMQDTGCLGLVHWDDPEVGRGFLMENTCTSVVDSR